MTPTHNGVYAPLPDAVASGVRQALRSRGIDQLFSQQAEAFRLARSGKNIVIATPTASGKSLCYNLPLLERFSREPQARALYLFPTKALAPGLASHRQSPVPGASPSRPSLVLPSRTPIPAACLHTSRRPTRRSPTSSSATRHSPLAASSASSAPFWPLPPSPLSPPPHRPGGASSPV
ncbi:DEAD/DEAH box helicase [Hyalangium versicolor]|uniref:DEAD/DEAH box helicase n=1 Tax=Hyalangium versicolor TaxID=2861190 RepID=UPI002814A068|nr:DEAD/DEAH box helicase [Hyalangium versicolor]